MDEKDEGGRWTSKMESHMDEEAELEEEDGRERRTRKVDEESVRARWTSNMDEEYGPDEEDRRGSWTRKMDEEVTRKIDTLSATPS